MRKHENNVIDLFLKEIKCTDPTLKTNLLRKTSYVPPVLSKQNFDLNLTEWLFLNRQDTFIYLGYLRAALLCQEEKQITADRAKQLVSFFDWYVSKKTQDFLDAGVSQKTAFYSTYTEFGFSEDFAMQYGISLLVKPIFDAIADLLQPTHEDLLRAILKSVYSVYTIEALSFNFLLNSHAFSLLLKVPYTISPDVFSLITRSKFTQFIPSPMKESLIFCNNSISQTDLIRLSKLTGTFYRYNATDLSLVLNNEDLKATERFDQFAAFSLTCVHPESVETFFQLLSKRPKCNLLESFKAIDFHKSHEHSQIKALIQRLDLHRQLKDF